MKKKLIGLVGMVMIIGCMSACGTKTEETPAPATEATEETESPATEATEETESEASGDKVYSTDDYSISYIDGLFEASEVRGMTQLVYCNKDLEFAGSNEIIITKDENTTADDIAAAIAGDDVSGISDGTLGAQVIPVKTYVRTSESPADSALTLVDSFMVMQSGDDVITVEIIRTVGQSDEVDMTIEGAFTYSLESFTLNK